MRLPGEARSGRKALLPRELVPDATAFPLNIELLPVKQHRIVDPRARTEAFRTGRGLTKGNLLQ